MRGSPFRSQPGSNPVSGNQTANTGKAIILVCYMLAAVNTNSSLRYGPVIIGMDFRYNEFLLQRAMVRKLHITSQKLLDVARELLTLALNLVEQAPKNGHYWCDIPWIVR